MRNFLRVCLSILGLCFIFLGFNTPIVNAQDELYTLSPALREYYALSSPIDAICDDDLLAIVQGGSAQTLLIHNEHGFKSMRGINLKQVKKLSDNILIVSDSGQIKKVNVSTLEQSRFAFDEPSNNFGGTFFDLNSDYLITSFSSQLDIYNLVGEEITSRHELSGISIAQDAPVAINSQNYIFYVAKEGASFSIYKRSLTQNDDVSIIATTVTKPTSIIANDEYVYFITGNMLMRVNVLDKSSTRLTTDGEKLFDLGYVTELDSPTNISFMNGNLLITDSLKESVEEFAIEQDKLVFTGFAVALDKTAFNRIQKDAYDISKQGDKIAILDNNKTTVVNNNKDFDYYSSNSYQNYLHGQNRPDAVAMGSKALLAYKGDNSVMFAGDQTGYSFGENNIKDICYQNEKYYVLTDDGTFTKVFYALDTNANNTSELNFTQLLTIADAHCQALTVDVFGNVYSYNNYNLYKNENILLSEVNITDFATDLVGNLFTVNNNQFSYLDPSENTLKPIKTLESNVTAFAMDYISNKVYFLLADSQFVYYTFTLNNISINENLVPEQFITSGSYADFSKLEIFTLQEGQNAYKITCSQDITYQGLSEYEQEYLKVCDLTLLGVNGENTFGMLISRSGITIANTDHLIEKQLDKQAISKQVFVTTGVNAYFLPVLTNTDDYVIVDNELALRLEKGTKAQTNAHFTFLGVEYYFATLEDGKTVYLPATFTVEILSKDYISNNYTLETVSDTKVFACEDLTSEIGTLTKGDKVKVLTEQTDSDCVAIYFEVEGQTIVAYIPKSAIINAPSTAVRNILVVLAVITCACGSLSFFLLRKKRS